MNINIKMPKLKFGKIKMDTVEDLENVKIDYEKDEYKIITTKEEYKSKALILATGNKKNAPKIKGIKEFEGKGISYCAICDGFFYKNKDVAVLGSGDYAISETNELINIAKKVTILTNEKQAPNVRAKNVKIKLLPLFFKGTAAIVLAVIQNQARSHRSIFPQSPRARPGTPSRAGIRVHLRPSGTRSAACRNRAPDRFHRSPC